MLSDHMHLQPDSIRVMGDKSTARETMKNAGVPTVPGSDGLLKVLLCWIIISCVLHAELQSKYPLKLSCIEIYCHRAQKKESNSPTRLGSL